MSKPSVYLAGPIKGLTYDDSQEWRIQVILGLAKSGIDAFSPLRAKAFLKNEGIIEGSYDYAPMSSQKGITARDRFDATTRDLLLVNFQDWQSISAGTLIELGWADARRIPIVGVGSFDHPMVDEIVNFWAGSLGEGIDVVKAILLP